MMKATACAKSNIRAAQTQIVQTVPPIFWLDLSESHPFPSFCKTPQIRSSGDVLDACEVLRGAGSDKLAWIFRNEVGQSQ
jgi:hypothetical protein